MKILALALLAVMFAAQAWAYPVTSPKGKTLKVHWAVLEAKSGKMSEMAAISARTVAKFTPNEPGSYSLYGGIDSANPDIMRLLEIYEDESAYEIHRSSAGFKAFIEERKPILETLTILPVDPIVLEQKAEGRAKTVSMTLVEVKPECLEEFRRLTVQEFTRAVNEDAGVLALFATSEQGERSNFVHTLEIFTDDEAREKYLASEKFRAFTDNTSGLVRSAKVFTNKPTNILLSRKGLHLNMLESLKRTDPEFAAFFGNFAYVEAVKESKLDPRTRYMAIIATLLGCQGLDAFRAILPEALDSGLTPSEVREVIYQGTAYLGLGRTYPFIGAANEVFAARGVRLPLPEASTTTPETRIEAGNGAQVEIFGEGMKGFQNAGPEETRHINRWLAGNCFGDYYTRKGLTLKEREMITFCYIAAQGGCEPQLTAHAKGNMNMGNDKAFLIDVVSQCLPYLGYPRSLNAITCINKAAE
ncbi:MAG: carboxymuconolactone decarboxylase family protein [Synergistaceae bacterium]|nr:carboxymuconolactone decarboxylase family protein [Synergistaceae bacterium]